MNGKVIAVIALLALCAENCSSSAIPMWEYLSKEEKVTSVHSFKQQSC